MLAGVTHHVTAAIAHDGAYAVFALMALDALVPFGSELIMLYAGVIVAGAVGGTQITVIGDHVPLGVPGFTLLVTAGTLGSLVGALVGYALGAAGGRALLDRPPRWLHGSPQAFERARSWFDRYGALAVFLGRMTPVVRSLISIPAGACRYPLGVYTALTLLGSLLWCLAFAGVGWSLAGAWESFQHGVRYADYAGAALAVAMVVAVVRRRGHRSAA